MLRPRESTLFREVADSVRKLSNDTLHSLHKLRGGDLKLGHVPPPYLIQKLADDVPSADWFYLRAGFGSFLPDPEAC